MADPLQIVKNLRNVPHYDMHLAVKKVIVVLTSPRSGSSLLKNILASHPDIASLDGEIEPYLALTDNGFGFDSSSDAIATIAHQRDLLDNIFDDLSVATDELPSLIYLKKRWERRLLLQFPSLFSNEPMYNKMRKALDDVVTEENLQHFQEGMTLQTLILNEVFCDERWRINYYDGHLHHPSPRCFNEENKIEEPPFVLPRNHRRPFSKEDAASKVLLFKTPPDAYRIGMYERLFPNAQIKYLYLTRGFAQVVNGLLDGWLSPVGFFSHNLKKMGITLQIKGYSDCVTFGKQWWKFDLPPNWKEFTHACLEDVCLNQWMSTHQAIRSSRVSALRIRFETFIVNPSAVVDQITAYFGMRPMKLNDSLPVTMATEAPQLRRWEKRKSLLLELGKRTEVKEMMDTLGYEMAPAKWL